MVLIVVLDFTAASTNIFQNDNTVGDLLNLNSIPGQLIYTNQAFIPYLEQFDVRTTSIDNYDSLQLYSLLEGLGDNYLVVDGPYSDYLVRQHCYLYTSLASTMIINYSVMFHENFPQEMISKMNEAIITSQAKQEFVEYADEYYSSRIDLNTCRHKRITNVKNITFYEVQGLWQILMSGSGVGILFLAIGLLRKFVNKNIRVYNLTGIRAKMDRKIQRRVATILAIHIGISLQGVTFLRKINQEASEAWLWPKTTQFSKNARQLAYSKALNIMNESDNGQATGNLNRLNNFSGGFSAAVEQLKNLDLHGNINCKKK